jgi:hypothetical protein
MLKYDTEKLDYRLYRKALGKWIKQKLVTADVIPDAYQKIGLGYKPYDWLKRFGLYIVMIASILSSSGFVLFFLLQTFNIELDGKAVWVFLLLAGVVLLVMLNRHLAKNNVYKQGTDDAMLHVAACYVYFGLLQLTGISVDTDQGVLFALITLCCITGFAAYQYADSFLFILFVFGFNCIPLYIVSMINQELLFFAVLLVVPLNYWVIHILNKWDKLKNHYWFTCFVAGRIAACTMMYISVNLYIIRSLAYSLMGAASIPLQPLFLVLTIAVPLIFIGSGIRQKLKHLLYCGLFLIIPTIATVRYYYSVIPAEIACMIGGLALIAVSYLTIRYLQQQERAYTFEADPEEDVSDMETLLILQQFGKPHAQPAPTPGETQFGDGTFGGGGSGGGF